MNEGFEGDTNRFPPADKIPAGNLPAVFEAGVVEVEFRHGVMPQIAPTSLGKAASISSPSEANLSELNKILKRYKLEQAEPSVATAEEELTTAHAAAREVDDTVPHLANFVTMHFPAEADTQQIAQELSRLPEVERAVAIPKAIPPQTPLNEPLVGASDQVVLNPGTGLENQ